MTLSKFRIRLVFSLVMISIAACGHKGVKEEEGTSGSAVSSDSGTSDAGTALGLKTIHFELDSSLLSSESKTTLGDDIRILKENPHVRVQLEGHCDNRGGTQYNLALGERRAQSVKHYLTDNGIPTNRLATVSFGKEKPLDTADTDEARAKNRRVNFALIGG